MTEEQLKILKQWDNWLTSGIEEKRAAYEAAEVIKAIANKLYDYCLKRKFYTGFEAIEAICEGIQDTCIE